MWLTPLARKQLWPSPGGQECPLPRNRRLQPSGGHPQPLQAEHQSHLAQREAGSSSPGEDEPRTLWRERQEGARAGVAEPEGPDLPLATLSAERRAGGVWAGRGTTEMAKKTSFKDNSGNQYESLPFVREFASFIKAFFFQHISLQNVFVISSSSLFRDPPRCLNWLNTG